MEDVVNNLDGIFGETSTRYEFLLATVPVVGQIFGGVNVICNGVKLCALDQKMKRAAKLSQTNLDESFDLEEAAKNQKAKSDRTWKIMRGVAEFFWLPGMALYTIAALVSNCLNRGKVTEKPLDFTLELEGEALWNAVKEDFKVYFKAELLKVGLSWSDELLRDVDQLVKRKNLSHSDKVNELAPPPEFKDLVESIVLIMESIEDKKDVNYLRMMSTQWFGENSEQAKRIAKLTD